MNWLRLDPESLAARTHAAGARPPSMGESLVRGIIGFTVVSFAGFAPWVVAGRWFYRQVGEVGLYAACALVFIGSSGLLLHRLIMGPQTLGRFYALFAVAFASYSVGWTAGWMALGGVMGSLVGLMLGTLVMGVVLAWAFGERWRWWQVARLLFIHNAAGYFMGEAVAAELMRSFRSLGMLIWGGVWLGDGGRAGHCFLSLPKSGPCTAGGIRAFGSIAEQRL